MKNILCYIVAIDSIDLNFDGSKIIINQEISMLAKQQVEQYKTVEFLNVNTGAIAGAMVNMELVNEEF